MAEFHIIINNQNSFHGTFIVRLSKAPRGKELSNEFPPVRVIPNRRKAAVRNLLVRHRSPFTKLYSA
jgi:hypothetical protein